MTHDTGIRSFCAKSQARILREQTMPISVISMQQLQGTVSDVQSILAKTVGVTIRATGGLGSTSRLSVRGLEGKRIGFFIDETPMTDQSDFVDLNDIPVDMIDRIEIYKGVVPAKFGGSSMGGAVNIVIKEYPEHYADVSYQRESYNTNRFQTVVKKNDFKHGLVYGIGGGYTYAANDYTMDSPYIDGLKIYRDHDAFRKVLLGGSIKAHKWWFDEVELEPVYVNTYHEIQGIDTDIRYAHSKSQGYLCNMKLVKDDFLVEGLDFDMSTAIAYTRYSMVDTAKTYYDWNDRAYATPSPYGGEITGNRYASDSDNGKFTLLNKLYMEYLINQHHSLTFNSLLQTADGRPSDETKVLSLGKKVDFDSRMRSWVVGLTYDFRSTDQRFLNSITGRYYWYGMDTRYQNLYVNIPAEDISLRKTSAGFSEAMRYRITKGLMAKLSGGYDVRIPSENELLGDGATITPAEQLMPERNLNFNAGLLYDLTGIHPTNLQIELNSYYMHVDDMIRFVKGILGAQYQNFGEMRTIGVEAEVKADICPWLYGYANVTYQDLPGSSPYTLLKINDSKAYIPLYGQGNVQIIDPKTLKLKGEIDLSRYAFSDQCADPAMGIIRGDYMYLTLDQIGPTWMPFENYRQTDLAIIDINADTVVKVISETESGLCFPTRPFLPDMIFMNEAQDIYITCTGYFGYDPSYLKNGFVCIPAGQTEFDSSRSWDISNTVIEGTDNWKPATVYNTCYMGNGKLVAYVGLLELNGDNPYTARNTMAVVIDLNNKTISKINGIPYTDGHSCSIVKYQDKFYLTSYGVDKSGVFSFDPATGAVEHVISCNSDLSYLYIF